MTRFIQMPGAIRAERMLAVPARVLVFEATLPAGSLLLNAVRAAFAERGLESGVLELYGGGFGPFAYVMPALSQTTEHAAFYSAMYRPDGMTHLLNASMTFGLRDNAPFFHCHGLWREADGVTRGGHVIPEDTRIAEPITAKCWALSGAAFNGQKDSETNFKLFEPVASAIQNTTATQPAYALRLLPNQDFCAAIEAFCAERGIVAARLYGGVGSLIGARFEDGSSTDNFATETFITNGVVNTDASGQRVAEIEIGLVDYTGAVLTGRLVRGDNPVLMTMELVVVDEQSNKANGRPILKELLLSNSPRVDLELPKRGNLMGKKPSIID